MKKFKSVIFPRPKKIGKRNWGEEILLGILSKKFSFKYLKLKKNLAGGLQYHRKKNEFGYLVSGTLQITFLDKKGKLIKKKINKGSVFHIPPGTIHKEKAITTCEIIEVSTPHFNDRVRVEDKFGIKDKSGLKTTKISEIKHI